MRSCLVLSQCFPKSTKRDLCESAFVSCMWAMQVRHGYRRYVKTDCLDYENMLLNYGRYHMCSSMYCKMLARVSDYLFIGVTSMVRSPQLLRISTFGWKRTHKRCHWSGNLGFSFTGLCICHLFIVNCNYPSTSVFRISIPQFISILLPLQTPSVWRCKSLKCH